MADAIAQVYRGCAFRIVRMNNRGYRPILRQSGEEFTFSFIQERSAKAATKRTRRIIDTLLAMKVVEVRK